MTTREDNDVFNRTSAVYTDNDTKLSWSVELSVDYHKNQMGQLHD